MNILLRDQLSKTSEFSGRISFLEKDITLSELYFNDIVAINFQINNETFFFILKNKFSTHKDTVLSSSKLLDMLSDDIKAISIDLNKINQRRYSKECKIINKFIKEVGLTDYAI